MKLVKNFLAAFLCFQPALASFAFAEPMLGMWFLREDGQIGNPYVMVEEWNNEAEPIFHYKFYMDVKGERGYNGICRIDQTKLYCRDYRMKDSLHLEYFPPVNNEPEHVVYKGMKFYR